MIKIMKEIVRGLFPSEYAAADAIGHDPFNGHGPEDAGKNGKSWFDIGGNNEYVAIKDGPCNAGDGMPCEVAAELVKQTRDDDTARVFVYRLVPVKMEVEVFRGSSTRAPTPEEVAEGVTCGYEVVTDRVNGEIVVKEVHGCLQLCACDMTTKESSTTEFTVAITHEPDGEWVLAAVYPGRPGDAIGEYLETAKHYDFGKEVEGFKPDDVFDDELLMEPPPSWVYDHIVKIVG